MEGSRDVIGRIRRELEQLEERREKLLHALEVIEDLGLVKNGESFDARILSAGANGGDPLARDDLSLSDAARIVIEQEHRPLSVPEIADRLLDSSFEYEKDEKTLKRSLSGVLGRWVRKGEEFFRPEKGKYAPMEWRGDREQLSIED